MALSMKISAATLPQHCHKAKEGDSQVGKEFWRQDESLKDLPRTL
jgi:hypothetical protein